MKPAAGQPRLPRPYQDDYAYCTHDLTWWTCGSDLGVARGQAGTWQRHADAEQASWCGSFAPARWDRRSGQSGFQRSWG